MPPIAENRTNANSHQPLVAHDAPEASPGSTIDHSLQGTSFTSSIKDDLQGTSLANPKDRLAVPKSMDRYSLDPEAARACFSLEPCLYSLQMLKQAAVILETMGEGRPDVSLDRRQSAPVFHQAGSRPCCGVPSAMPPLVFENPEEKQHTFELALSALNYEMVFDDILEDCEFFKLYPKLQEEKALVMVVLWDYQTRKFQPRRRERDEDQWEAIGLIETALQEQQTKLKACLARRRIKASAPKIEFLLPDSVRRRSSSQRPMPTCAWVNALKTDLMEVVEELRAGGLTYLPDPPESGQQFQNRSFYQDPHCCDMMVFSVDCGLELLQHRLVQQGHLVCQDKSSCLAAHSLVPLSIEDRDVLVVNPGPGWLMAHLAVLLRRHSGAIVVVSQYDDHDHDKMLANLELVGATKNVKVIREAFTQLKTDDSRLKNVTSALVIADCSKSAINHMVQYIVTEGESLKLLGKLTDTTDMEARMDQLQADHVAHLRHVLTMHKLRSVAYLTRSVHEAENEAVVDKSVEYVNLMQGDQKLMPWMVVPPVLPFSAHDVEHQHGIDDRYIHFQPSDLTSGCFLVCLARRPEDAGSIIARARSKGLLGKPSKSKKGQSGVDQEDGSGDCDGGAHGGAQRRGSYSKRSKVLRCLSSPVRPPTLKVVEYKIPDHQKVVFHPNPFK